MNLNDEPLSLYDTLELTPDATPQEIRSAYLRLKSAYNKDNIAHYTLFSRDETEKMLQAVENAYLVLSNPEKRKAYDLAQGHITATDINNNWGMARNEFSSPSALSPADQVISNPSTAPSPYTAPTSQPSGSAEVLISRETEWTGAAIRSVREARRLSLDDLSDYTRISRAYLHALEEEDYKRLPAAVYVRGFLQQIGKHLKIPVDALIQKYIARLKSARPD